MTPFDIALRGSASAGITRRIRLTAAATPWLLAAPSQLMLAGVIGVPSLYVVWLSLTQSTYGKASVWVGLANYRGILTDPYFWHAFLNTVVLVNLVVYIELAVALGIAVLFAGGVPARRAMIAIMLAPYAVSEVVAVMIWRYLMEPDIGPITHALASLGLPSLNWAANPVAALALIGLINLWMHLPFTFVLLYTGLLAIPQEIYDAARIDGAGPWAEFLRVTLPMLMPAILVAVLFRIIFAFRMFTEVWLLTQGGPARSTEVMALYLYVTGFRYNDFGAGAATGCLMLVGSLLISVAWLRRAYWGMFARA
jgi:multiple sugar transport system permease protein